MPKPSRRPAKATPEPRGPVKFTTEIWIGAPASRVWQLVTKGAWLDQYFTSHTTGDLDAPGVVRLSWGDIHEDIEVLSAAWEKRTVFRWMAYRLDYATRVTLALTSKHGLTRVSITESGWKRDPKSTASALHHAVGWTHFLAQLKAFAQFGIQLRT